MQRARGGRYLGCRGALLAASLGEVVEALEGGEETFLAPSVREGQRTPPERGLISGTDLNRCTYQDWDRLARQEFHRESNLSILIRFSPVVRSGPSV